MRLISSTSRLRSSTSGVCAMRASESLKRVRIVRRSWLTPLSMVGALLDVALDAPLHLEEGVAGLAHFARAARAETRSRALCRSASAASDKAQDRPDLVAQEQDRDAEQDQRRAGHPDEEDVRVGGVGLRAAGEHPHDRVGVELDADLDEVRAPDRIDPVGAVDLRGAVLPTGFRRGSRRTALGPAAAGRCRAGCPRRAAAAPTRCARACWRSGPADSSRRCR